MKTKTTFKAIAFYIIAFSATLLSSCSTSNQLASQSPRYHLNLVKADTHSSASDKKEQQATNTEIIPLSRDGSLTSFNSDNQIKDLNKLLKSDMKVLTKQVKKSNPQIYRQIKTVVVPKDIQQLTANNFKTTDNNILSTSNINEYGEHHFLSLWITFLIISLVFFVFTYAIPILYIFGLIAFIAAVIFFILWIAALA